MNFEFILENVVNFDDMYYSELFFNKDVYSITELDIVDFFKQPVEESSILEFKSGNVTIEKIYGEVSALHNSQGGLLIIGSPIPTKDKNGREFFEGDLTRSGFRSKDWLYQKIYSKVSPPPVNLKIHDVKCSDGKIIQIIDIPKSINPPHQCLDDGKYYIRYETETKFAPHGLIEALFNRRKEPIVLFEFNQSKFSESKFPTLFELIITNSSDIPVVGINFSVSFYNVESVINNTTFNDLILNLMSMKLPKISDTQQRHASSLVKGLEMKIDYNISHLNEPFFIITSAWGDNMNLCNKGFLISPNDCKYKIYDVFNDHLSDTIQQIIKVREEKFDENPDVDWDGFDRLVEKIKLEYNL